MQNKWNQSQQKAAGLLLFIPHPRVSNASTGIHSHMETGNPPGLSQQAGKGRIGAQIQGLRVTSCSVLLPLACSLGPQRSSSTLA